MEGHKLEDGFLLLLSHEEMVAVCVAVGDTVCLRLTEGNLQILPNKKADIAYDDLYTLLPKSALK